MTAERGPKGDHGQPGHAGMAGPAGADGPVGETGDRGKTGAPGENAKPGDFRWPIIGGLVLITVAFSLFAYRGEQRDRAIAATADAIEFERAVSVYNDCLNEVEFTRKYNTRAAELAEVDREALAAAETDFQRRLFEARIAVYEQGLLPEPRCARLKPEGYEPPTPPTPTVTATG